MEYELIIESPRPFFAELPCYLWETVNYDSEGDCKHPTDREWSWLEITNRDTDDALAITSQGERWKISGEDPIAARAAMFFFTRCSATKVNPIPNDHVGMWQHDQAMARANRIAEEFASPRLKIFDSHLFWGSWKWIGWFATDFTWVGRWIMVAILKGDPRGVPLCIDWLEQGTFNADQTKALMLALHELTGESFDTDAKWVKWYKGGLFKKGAKERYPEPDFNAWLEDLKSEYGSSQQDAAADAGKPHR